MSLHSPFKRMPLISKRSMVEKRKAQSLAQAPKTESQCCAAALSFLTVIRLRLFGFRSNGSSDLTDKADMKASCRTSCNLQDMVFVSALVVM